MSPYAPGMPLTMAPQQFVGPMGMSMAPGMGAQLLQPASSAPGSLSRAWNSLLVRLGVRDATPVNVPMPTTQRPARPATSTARPPARPARPAPAPVAPATLGMPAFPGIQGMVGLPGAGLTGVGLAPNHSDNGPQVNASNQSGLALGTNGMQQRVTNDNHFDDRGFSISEMPFGGSPWNAGMYGYGTGAPYASVMGWSNPMGYMPMGAYGASMSGYAVQPGASANSGVRGLFDRMLGT
jgi:hypothetical protein